MGGAGARGKDLLRARVHHLCLTDSCLVFLGGGGQGNMAIYFKGTLENNSLFLGNKTYVREGLKIILRNKADHEKKLCLLYPFLPTYIPPTQHILWHFLEIIIHFWSYCYKKITVFSFTQQRKKMHAKYFPAYLPIQKYRVGVLQIQSNLS